MYVLILLMQLSRGSTIKKIHMMAVVSGYRGDDCGICPLAQDGSTGDRGNDGRNGRKGATGISGLAGYGGPKGRPGLHGLEGGTGLQVSVVLSRVVEYSFTVRFFNEYSVMSSVTEYSHRCINHECFQTS